MIRYSNTYGMLIPGDIGILQDCVCQIPHGASVVEIGSLMGASALVMLDVRPDIDLHCIDTWAGSPEHAGDPDLAYIASVEPGITAMHLFERAIGRHPGASVTAYQGRSADMVEHCTVEPHLLFVDGSHVFEDVLSDLCLYGPRVKSCGMILVHDCVDEVRRAVETYAEDSNLRMLKLLQPPRANFMAVLVTR